MNWNNAKLNEIQAIENALISNPNILSKLFTNFIHSTKEFINPQLEDENIKNYKPIEIYVVPEYSGYKFYAIKPSEMDAIIDKIAKFIELGSNLNVACTLAGYSYNVLRPKFTVHHKERFKIARELKYKNNN
jgi:hypothetical protein